MENQGLNLNVLLLLKKCMDTTRDRNQLDEMIAEGRAPWMIWEE